MNAHFARLSNHIRRLTRETSGNAMLIVAGSLIPMVAMVGAGIEVSRFYMTQTRLQQACDAGVLTGRKVMGNGTWTTGGTTSADAQARQVFSGNFPAGYNGSEDLSFSFAVGSGNMVTGQASAVMPLALMQIFDFGSMPLSVDCTAKMDIGNTDIMFVLDVTGSMATVNTGDSASRIVGLRSAVLDFYDVLAASSAATSRIRYGFVPYSQNVNVGKILYDANPNWLVDEWTYDSREWNASQREAIAWGTPTSTPGTPGGRLNVQNGSWVDETTAVNGLENPSSTVTTNKDNACTSTALNPSPVASTPQPVGEPVRTNEVTSVDPATGVRTTTYTSSQSLTNMEYRWRWEKRNGEKDNRCYIERRTVTWTVRTNVTDRQEATEWQDVPLGNRWLYKPVTYDVEDFLDGDAVTLPVGPGGSNVSSTWNGCIEERDTVSSGTFNTIPAGAFDLDIDLVPNSNATRWRPSWPAVTFMRSGPAHQVVSETSGNVPSGNRNPDSECPAPARKMGVVTRSQVSTFVDTLRPTGNTYHDLGMLWGARLISPNGLFQSENETSPNGEPIARHIIFMTDGELYVEDSNYTPYGVERMSRRITGGFTNPNLWNRHNNRLLAICQMARNANITVWSVGFGIDVPDPMYTCAGDDPANKAMASRTFQADNTEQLKARFRDIANKIAALRLTQ